MMMLLFSRSSLASVRFSRTDLKYPFVQHPSYLPTNTNFHGRDVLADGTETKHLGRATYVPALSTTHAAFESNLSSRPEILTR